MFPLRDNIQPRSVPYVNYTLIGLCTIGFAIQLLAGDQGQMIVERLGMVPLRVAGPDEPIMVPVSILVQTPFGVQQDTGYRELLPALGPEWLTIFTSMFLHGGWLHFLGNMWFLYIFGDNVEDRFGKGVYLLTYLGCGVIAAMAHLITNSTSTAPTIGASGAIAGVMGAYLVLYPHARVLAVIPIIFFLQLVVLPAPLFLGLWFVIQFFNGAFSIVGDSAGGVAWWAHIGGFAAGAMLAVGMNALHRLQPSNERLDPTMDHSGFYRRLGPTIYREDRM